MGGRETPLPTGRPIHTRTGASLPLLYCSHGRTDRPLLGGESFNVSEIQELREAGERVPGKVCLVGHIPTCNFCERPGEFDFATRMGPWANGCEEHFLALSASRGELGLGKAQLWIMGPEGTV